MPSPFILAMLAIAVACAGPTDGITPYADYHVHLLGPYAAPAARYKEPITADRIVADRWPVHSVGPHERKATHR